VKDSEGKKGVLGWFASNHVAANLLMFLIIAAGLMAIFSAKMEVFPELSLESRAQNASRPAPPRVPA
jgi:hypothetical protein